MYLRTSFNPSMQNMNGVDAVQEPRQNNVSNDTLRPSGTTSMWC